MTITTIEQAMAGGQPMRYAQKSSILSVAGSHRSFWTPNGIPGAGALNSGINGAVYSSSSALVNGQVPFYDPGGSLKQYLHRLCVQMNGTTGMIYLADRLWDNTIALSSTSLQTITTPTWPARDINGSTNGDGVFLALEVTSQMSANSAVISSLLYTNSSGTSGRSGGSQGGITNFNTSANQPVGTFIPVGLAAGDTGVQAVNSITFSTAWTSGSVGLVAFRPIMMISLQANWGNSIDLISGCLPRLYNGTVPFFFGLITGASGSLSAAMTTTQG